MATVTPLASEEHPLKPLTDLWLNKIESAKKDKHEKFGKYADEAMKFFDGPHDWMWAADYATGGGGFLDESAQNDLPTFRMTVNRVFEAVALFGPALYHRNPQVLCTPKHFPEIAPESMGLFPQMDQQAAQYWQHIDFQRQAAYAVKETHAGLQQHYLNWLQHESDKKTQAQRAINEAIIKGMSTLWTEMYSPDGTEYKYPRSVYVSVDDIVIDPDAEYWEDVQWIARRCVHPVFEVEREYGLEPGTIKGHYSSKENQSYHRATGKASKNKGKSHDLIEYWQVYSKSGIGHRLNEETDRDWKKKFNFDMLGDFTYCVIAKDVPYPLNMPSEAVHNAVATGDSEELFMRAQWPIPYWTDGGWPMSRVHFYEKPKCVWPISLIKPAIGELRFVNWCMSFLADKVAASATTYVAMLKSAGEDIQRQVRGGMGPYTVVELSEVASQGGTRSIRDIISFLDAPSFSIDIWNMVSEVLEMIDKRTGLTDLIYGLTGSQMRSATEAEVRDANTTVRPDHMASQVEDWLGEVACKEMQAARWLLDGRAMTPVLGPLGAQVWEQQILTQEVDRVVRDFDFRIEAGSARKPNKNNRIRQLTEFGQVALPMLQQFATMGQTGPYNAYMQDWAAANDLDATPYLVQLPPPPEQQGPSPEELEVQKLQMELQMKQTELAVKQQEAQMNMEVKQHDMVIDQQDAQQELKQDQAQHKQEMEQSKEMHELDLKLTKEKAKADAKIAEKKANAQAKEKPSGD